MKNSLAIPIFNIGLEENFSSNYRQLESFSHSPSTILKTSSISSRLWPINPGQSFEDE